MAENVYVADIARHEGAEVTLHGWLHGRRSSGKLHFLQVRDGTGTIQCVVFKGNVTPEAFTEADHLPQETSLAVTGLVKKEPRSPIGYEIDVRGLSVNARPSSSGSRCRLSSSFMLPPSRPAGQAPRLPLSPVSACRSPGTRT